MPPPATAAELSARLRLPPGFQVEVYTKEVPNARAMALSDKGTLFVGSRKEGKVYAVVDADGDMRADRVHVLAEGLTMPVGVDLHGGDLYVSAVDRIVRLDDIEAHLDDPPAPVVVSAAFPSDLHHGWKFIRFGPDGLLYVPVGAPCNLCLKEDPRYASIMRMKPDGSELEVYAHGVRNTVGFDWHPQTGALWFTDNGRDWLGDDGPGDELNHASEKGQHFGYPFCHAGAIADPEYGAQRGCSEFRPPTQVLGPHVASLGMRFYTGDQFPERYRGAIFIAEHGSWNRAQPLGYRLSVVTLGPDGSARDYRPFAEGWLEANGAWGRPVDVLVHPDGSLLISDDRAGWIYRVRYQGE
ncbi:PQQ-dependent sugar dehydrogenase [Haliangium sp.]|uniref:PQQ-dependent sugar dehydrogenase n=1 Tax=Haliangium sp. TaxID=2663208 RepID=UPI003D11AD59